MQNEQHKQLTAKWLIAIFLVLLVIILYSILSSIFIDTTVNAGADSNTTVPNPPIDNIPPEIPILPDYEYSTYPRYSSQVDDTNVVNIGGSYNETLLHTHNINGAYFSLFTSNSYDYDCKKPGNYIAKLDKEHTVLETQFLTDSTYNLVHSKSLPEGLLLIYHFAEDTKIQLVDYTNYNVIAETSINTQILDIRIYYTTSKIMILSSDDSLIKLRTYSLPNLDLEKSITLDSSTDNYNQQLVYDIFPAANGYYFITNNIENTVLDATSTDGDSVITSPNISSTTIYHYQPHTNLISVAHTFNEPVIMFVPETYLNKLHFVVATKTTVGYTLSRINTSFDIVTSVELTSKPISLQAFGEGYLLCTEDGYINLVQSNLELITTPKLLDEDITKIIKIQTIGEQIIIFARTNTNEFNCILYIVDQTYSHQVKLYINHTDDVPQVYINDDELSIFYSTINQTDQHQLSFGGSDVFGLLVPFA